MPSKIALVSLVIILGLVNWSIVGKEKHLAEGRIVYLDLAPVDPRSLMQGDYMALRFRLGNEVHNALPKTKEHQRWRHNVDASDGYVVVSLDKRNIGSFKRLYKDQALSKNEILMRYRVRNGVVKLATNAFFFQEGHGKYYQQARYGLFRVDGRGELLLVAVFDKNLNKLGPAENMTKTAPLKIG
jgi:uncharacterized membrane-anchored protein